MLCVNSRKTRMTEIYNWGHELKRISGISRFWFVFRTVFTPEITGEDKFFKIENTPSTQTKSQIQKSCKNSCWLINCYWPRDWYAPCEVIRHEWTSIWFCLLASWSSYGTANRMVYVANKRSHWYATSNQYKYKKSNRREMSNLH